MCNVVIIFYDKIQIEFYESVVNFNLYFLECKQKLTKQKYTENFKSRCFLQKNKGKINLKKKNFI